MKRLKNTSLTLVLVSALGLAATGSAFAEGGQADFDAEMQRAPQSQGIYTEPASPGSIQHQRQMQYTPRNIEGSSASIVGVVTLVGDNMIKLVETDTGLTHEIRVTDRQEEALTTGYIINAELRNGRLVGFQEMGVPQDVKEVVYTAENLPDENVLEQPQRYRAF